MHLQPDPVHPELRQQVLQGATRPLAAIVFLAIVGAASLPGRLLGQPPPSPQDLAERGLLDQLLVTPAGDLVGRDVETGRTFSFGKAPGEAGGNELRSPAGPQLAVSPGGRRAFLSDSTSRVEVRLPDGTRHDLPLPGQVGAIAWLDDRRPAVSPKNADHLVQLWDVESGERLQEIEETPRISEAPGFRLLRSTTLAWDPARDRLHALDAFTGHLRVYDLSSSPPALVIEAQVEDPGQGAFEERVARIDRQLAEQGEFQGTTIWRFSAALDAGGTAWMVERCDGGGRGADSPAGTAHLLAVDPEGTEHRTAVETPCCSLTAVPWADVLAFVQAGEPGEAGCFATVPRPKIGTTPNGTAWMEVTPLTLREGASSGRGRYGPSTARRLGAEDDAIITLSEVARRDPGLTLVCTGGEERPVDCSQVWLDPDEPIPGDPLDDPAGGRPVTGRVTLEGAPQARASVALVPEELRTTRRVTLPLDLPAGAPEPIRQVLTGADGRFTLPPLAPGEYRLLLTLPGGRMDQGTTFEVAPRNHRPGRPEPPLDLGELDFPAGVRLDLAITDREGRPLPEALAGAAQEPEAADGPTETPGVADLYQVTADEDGHATIEGLAPDRPLVVTCQAPGHAPWRESFTTPPPYLECALDPLAAVTGRVVDEGGEPLSGATLTLTPDRSRWGGGAETTTAGEDGRFRFDDLEAGGHRLVAASPGRATDERTILLQPGEVRDVGSLTLDEGGRWTLRMVDGADREPIAGATLTALSPPAALAPATTDARGEVELQGPTEGPLTLEVRADGHAPRRVEVPESTRQPGGDPQEIVLERGGWIVAHVWNGASEEPCAGCTVTVSGRGPTQGLVTDASGSARSEPLAPGPWQASLTRLQGYGAVVTRSGGDDTRRVTVRPGATAEVHFGAPDDTLEVVLSPPPSEPGTWRLMVRDAHGAAHLHPLDGSGTATIERPRGAALLALMGHGMTVELATVPEDAADPTLIERPSGTLTARLPESPDGPVTLWLELVDLTTGRKTAEIEATAGAVLRVPYLSDGVYELRGGGRRLATATVIDGQETALGELR